VVTTVLSYLALVLGLPIVLVGMHLALWRLWRHPAPLFQRERAVCTGARVVCAVLGVGFIYLACAVVAFVALTTEPSAITTTLEPLRGGPADRAGVRGGDRAVRIDGQPVTTFEDFRAGIKRGGETVELRLERDSQMRRVTVTKGAMGQIGVTGRFVTMARAEALGKALALPARTAAAYLQAWFEAMTGRQQPAFMGPVAIAAMAGRRSFFSSWASLLSSTLPRVALAYLVLLLIDTRARRRYQASLRSS
jgi:membrane-associated protease RseP (regulator of RpoE activity)